MHVFDCISRSLLYAMHHLSLFQDERDRLNEDFQSARESIDQLRKEVSSSRQQSLASPDIQVSNTGMKSQVSGEDMYVQIFSCKLDDSSYNGNYCAFIK